MRVDDVMTPNPATVTERDSLRTARDRMHSHDCRRLPVLDDSAHVCGIITDRDLRLALNSPLIMRERRQDDLLLEYTEVGVCMTPNPICTTPETPLKDAIGLLLVHKISGLPVVDGEKLVGIVTITDLLHALQRLLN